MRSRRAGRIGSALVAVALATVAVALAQNGAPRSKAARGKAAPAKKAPPNAADPLENPAIDPLEKLALPGLVHYRLRVQAPNSVPLAMTYYPVYPARLGITAPVILMVHEKGRSGKDFEDSIADLKGQGIAEHMQGLGYSVILLDLRGHGANPRREVSTKEWRTMVDDLQTAYLFLVDRHNRGKLNLAKLGVLALGEGANLAAAWAYVPGGGVSSEGRTSDIGALALASPLPDGEGLLLGTAMSTLAPRIPTLLMVGARDPISAAPVRAVRPTVERTRQNRVEIFDSSLHGLKLLRFEPRVTAVITRFFEGTVKFKNIEWEPRYNLTPVTYGDIQLVRGGKPPTPAAKAKDAAKAKEAGKAKDVPKAKEDPAANEPAAAKKKAPE